MLRRLLRLAARVLLPSVLVPVPARAVLLALSGAQVGTGVRVRAGCAFREGQLILGDGVFLSHGCYLEDHATIQLGEEVWVGAGTKFLTATHDIGGPEKRAGMWRTAPITVGDGCWLGANVTVLSGVRIGAGCVVAAGAVVTEDCEPDTLYMGVPARAKRRL
jgi:maltose O-acetyltransferase